MSCLPGHWQGIDKDYKAEVYAMPRSHHSAAGQGQQLHKLLTAQLCPVPAGFQTVIVASFLWDSISTWQNMLFSNCSCIWIFSKKDYHSSSSVRGDHASGRLTPTSAAEVMLAGHSRFPHSKALSLTGWSNFAWSKGWLHQILEAE